MIILETKKFEITIQLPNTNYGHNRWPLLWLAVDPLFSNNFVRLLYVTSFLSVKTTKQQDSNNLDFGKIQVYCFEV